MCQDAGLSVGECARPIGDDPKTVLAHYDRRRAGEAESTRSKLNGAMGGTFGAHSGKGGVEAA